MLDLMTMFVTVFVAELGDKTQIATLLLAASGKYHPMLVFLAAATALVAAAALGVFMGTIGGRFLTLVPLKLIAGLGFMVLGLWQIMDHFRGA